MPPRRAVLYARVSTDGHTTRTQLRELEAVARRHHWHVVHRFVDQGISGARGREQRPQFEALHQAIARRECEVVLVWSIDRLGRSLSDLMGLLNELHAKHIDLYLHRQGIDTTTPAGKMLFQMLGVFAEFQRSLIQERVRAGLARSRDQGTRLGRPRVPPERGSRGAEGTRNRNRYPADRAGLAYRRRDGQTDCQWRAGALTGSRRTSWTCR